MPFCGEKHILIGWAWLPSGWALAAKWVGLCPPRPTKGYTPYYRTAPTVRVSLGKILFQQLQNERLDIIHVFPTMHVKIPLLSLSEKKTKARQVTPGMRRTLSLDAIVGPYLQGHWPKEPEGQASLCRKDQSTQYRALRYCDKSGRIIRIPSETIRRYSLLSCCPVYSLHSFLLVSQILEVPDGHRAPVPPLSCSSGSQSDPSTTPLSPTPSPCVAEGAELSPRSPVSSQGGWEPSPLLLSSSPRPNKSYCFQREPPEGCEKVRVCEETSIPHLAQSSLLLSSCPDPNKVNFTPHGGSAFCPVSLLKPLLPSMDLLFRSLAVSPATGCSGQGADPYQAPSPGLVDCAPPPKLNTITFQSA
uniref:Family with sequence similarity 117 member Aa n=1 Tax=Hucho hucho TaxID=62062 RepID=A0A4W5M440_9TELE